MGLSGLVLLNAIEPDLIRHTPAMPDVPGPDGLPQWEFARPDRHEDREMMARFERDSPVELRAVNVDAQPETAIPTRRVWMRVRGELPEVPAVHAGLLAYASDRGLIATARIPHGFGRGNPASASLDHAIWFHRPPRFDDWLLYTSESPVAHAARALIYGQMYRRDVARQLTVPVLGRAKDQAPASPVSNDTPR